jgi:hypothetical protein
MTYKYTVLVLRPDYQRCGHQSDWIYRAHVEAPDVTEAAQEGLRRAGGLRGQDDPYSDYAVLAIYHGHLDDVYVY